MTTRRFGPKKGTPRPPPLSEEAMAELVRRARELNAARAGGYREQSLRIHGWICAKCAREFEAHNLHLLTVHHRDHDHDNNPPDGSNWENLCVDCHDEEHRKDILARYMESAGATTEPDTGTKARGGLGTLGDLLAARQGRKL